MNTQYYFQQLTSLETEITFKQYVSSLEEARKNIGRGMKKRKSTLMPLSENHLV